MGASYGKPRPAHVRSDLVARQRRACTGRDRDVDELREQYAAFVKVPTIEWVDDRFATARAINLPRNVRGEYKSLLTERERKAWRERRLNGLRRDIADGIARTKRECAKLTAEVSGTIKNGGQRRVKSNTPW